ncbi:MAG: NmrA/HSCARG family protein [Gemmatimonadales bacterium]
MPDRRTIAVIGATGAQGGGLARAILSDPSRAFAVRALTRKPGSDNARALQAAGAEVVAGDLDDPASLERAFRGGWGLFALTNFWEHLSPEREFTQAGNQARAAKQAGVSHVIWSTLEDTRRWVPLDDDRMPTLMGRYKVPHLDAKGEADATFRETGVPTTFLLTSFYWDNFIHFGMGPKRGPDGRLAITFPVGKARLPGIAVEDIGKSALGIFRRAGDYAGKTVGIAGEHLTGAEMAAGFSQAFGEEVRYNDVPPEVYRGFGFPGAEDLGNMFQFMRDFSEDFRRPRDVEATRRLNPELQSFGQWLERNKSRIPLD